MTTLNVHRPYDNQLITSLEEQDWSTVDGYLAEAKELSLLKGESFPKEQRMQVLLKAADLVEKDFYSLAKSAAEEGGKPLTDSVVELKRAVQGLREAANCIPRLEGREIPMGLNGPSMNRMAYTFREPVGVVVAVSAFNHPFNLIVHQVAPAIATGCPVLIKPAPTTPISCVNLVEIFKKAGLPDGFLKLVICDNGVAEKLVTDPRISFFSFIGSAKVGWMLKSKLAPGVHCALEHGGVAPVIMDDSADFDAAVAPLVKGGFYHAGQVCVSVQRVYVSEKNAEAFAKKIAAAAEKLIVGDPLDDKTEVGPLILPREVDRVESWVNEAKDKHGGQILCGGKRISDSLYSPTVILNPSDEALVSQNEIFGPVVCVYSYKSIDEALERANNVPYSFQASVFSKDIDTALYAVKRLEAAAVMVNDHTAFRVDWMPFGGRKHSGMGVGGILPTMLDMTEEKLMVIKSDKI